MERYMKRILRAYDDIRGAANTKEQPPFWDVVVITTVDREQQRAYELQIALKLERRELPVSCDYVVNADPPGIKCGNGGATLASLSYLYEKYEEKLYDMKVLMLHSGGQSQRLPHASVLGKIFTILPFGSPTYQMIDLQLALYVPFIKFMNPGVFLTSSDAFFIFNIEGCEEDIKFSPVTALAHISPIEVGTSHGVYVIDGDINTAAKLESLKCKQVLQKPSVDEILKSGAVLNRVASPSTGPTHDQVYTDSVFYFDHSITKSFLKLYEEIRPLRCEIDAYGDFLQALGSSAEDSYFYKNITTASTTQDLVEVRRKLFRVLKGVDLTILALNSSSFLHLGTFDEYLYHLCDDGVLNQIFTFSQQQFSLFDHPNKQFAKTGRIIHSIVSQASLIHEQSVVEFCHFEQPVIVNEKSVISNCQLLNSNHGNQREHTIQIPQNVFMHTVPVLYNQKTSYVTIFFGINDDVKQKPHSRDTQYDLSFLSKPLNHFAQTTRVSLDDIVSNELSPCSLWECKLFPLCDSMSRSFVLTNDILSALVGGHNFENDLSYYTMFSSSDVVKFKHVEVMLEYRKHLSRAIRDGCFSS